MCTEWIINGRVVENGLELVEAIGRDAAMSVNSCYEIPGLSEADADKSCLCHVDPRKLAQVTGTDWRYDPHEDAMVPTRSQVGG